MSPYIHLGTHFFILVPSSHFGYSYTDVFYLGTNFFPQFTFGYPNNTPIFILRIIVLQFVIVFVIQGV